MTPCFVEPSEDTVPTYILSSLNFDEFYQSLNAKVKIWVDANGFKGKFGQALICPNEQGGIERALLGIGSLKYQDDF